MITCTRRITFDAGHRVWGHENKCANLHGHSYRIFATASPAEGLDTIGRVIDFSVLKDRLGSWIDTNWDHGFLYYHLDREMQQAFAREELISMKTFKCPFNPTAEELAQYLLHVVGPMVLGDTSVRLTRVRVFETENCYADASL